MKNMRILSLVTFFLVLTVTGLQAQQKMLNIEDASRRNPSLSPETINQLQWIGKTDKYSFVDKQQILVSAEPGSGKTSTLVPLKVINQQILASGQDTLKNFPRVNYISDSSFYFVFKSTVYTYNFITGKLLQVNTFNENAASSDVEAGTLAVAYTIGNNLYVSTKSSEFQVTNDADLNIVNGQSVHRDEFGIYKGTFWSPAGKYLAFYRMDQTMVTDYPLVNTDERVGKLENIKYPMAGMTSHQVTLGIFSMKDHTTRFIETGLPADQYLTCVTWDPDEKHIYIAVLNREQNHLKLNKYDITTGAFVKTLFEERHEKYVEPEWPLYFLKSKPGQFIWASERDGFNHLFLYDTEGQLLKQLTSGAWVVTGITGTDTKDENVFFTSTKESPLQNNIYRVNIKTLEVIRLSPDHGSHDAIVAHSGNFILDLFSSTEKFSCVKMLDKKGKVLRTLLEGKNPLGDYKLGEMSVFTVKADDQTDLYCRMIKPVDFDPAKKYPVFVYVYGGPHAQLVTDSRLGGADLFMYYMAQEGYVVLTLDNRGTANRGRDFEQAIFRNLGEVEVSDQMAGINYLKSLPYVDPDRIGVNGWSYGGFLTISMMLKHPEVFKVGVAGGPVIDWKFYEIMYGERYMDTPLENPDGYEKASLLNQAKNLEGRLLVIHGTVDPTVVWQNSLTFLKKCVDLGKQLDYFVYPGHPHNVRGKDRVHLNQKIAMYFNEHL